MLLKLGVTAILGMLMPTNAPTSPLPDHVYVEVIVKACPPAEIIGPFIGGHSCLLKATSQKMRHRLLPSSVPVAAAAGVGISKVSKGWLNVGSSASHSYDAGRGKGMLRACPHH
jgi:hypothetical protein